VIFVIVHVIAGTIFGFCLMIKLGLIIRTLIVFAVAGCMSVEVVSCFDGRVVGRGFIDGKIEV
jgi:hypothetical protein